MPPRQSEQPPDHAQDGQCTTFKDGSLPDIKGFGKLEIARAGAFMQNVHARTMRLRVEAP